MTEAVVVEAQRTPVGRHEGTLEDVRPDHLAGYLTHSVLRKNDLDPMELDEVVWGCVDQVGEQAMNIGRNMLLAAGLPVDIPAITVVRQCGSSQTAINMASSLIADGAHDVILAGGVENMTRVPARGNMDAHGTPFGPWYEQRYEPVSMGTAAEMLAEQENLDRDDMDQLSYESHVRAGRAIREGRFDREIIPLPVDQMDESAEEGPPAYPPEGDEEDLFSMDEGVRMEPDLEAMKDLDPVFKEDGFITPANASQISDGASAVLLMSREKADELGFEPRAKILTYESVGVDPVLNLTGPIPATEEVLDQTGMNLGDVDLVEINEAFASVVLAWAKHFDPDMDRVNVNGGAISRGHPLGATGGILFSTLLHELERRDEQIGLQTMCCGGGQGVATVIDRDV